VSRKPIRTNQFKKDVESFKSRNGDTTELKYVLDLLIEGKRLPARYREHPLRNVWRGYWDCHIQPDEVLIYKPEKDKLYLERLGPHSELFRNQ
jgi:mRNA interferase YafQ